MTWSCVLSKRFGVKLSCNDDDDDDDLHLNLNCLKSEENQSSAGVETSNASFM
jgi:hypothetical protein